MNRRHHRRHRFWIVCLISLSLAIVFGMGNKWMLPSSAHLPPLASFIQSPPFIHSPPFIQLTTTLPKSLTQKVSSPHALVEQGRQFYQTEQFSDAAALLEQAVHAYEQQGRSLNQALVLNYLSLAEFRLGLVDVAGDRLQTSLHLLAVLDEMTKGKTDEQQQVYAQVLTTYGQFLLSQGNPEAAIEQWQRAHQMYDKLNDATGELGTEINQIQALRAMGRYRLAQKRVDDVSAKLETHSDPILQLIGWRSLGNILHLSGQLEAAANQFEKSLALAQTQQRPNDIATAWLSIGNVERDRNQSQAALDAYQKSAALATTAVIQSRARLNQLGLQIALGQTPTAQAIHSISAQLDQLPPSRFASDAHVNLAHHLIEHNQIIQSNQPNQSEQSNPSHLPFATSLVPTQQIEAVLNTALTIAHQLDDPIAESYARGTLGHLYEWGENLSTAKANTRLAIQAIQNIRANDIAYQWHWQMGRLLQQEKQLQDNIGKRESLSIKPEPITSEPITPESITIEQRTQILSSYNIAFQLLQALRQDLAALETDVQFSFRQTIEPFYRQYADILLQDPTQTDLRQARTVIESLQLAELDNFFQDACSTAQPELVDQVVDAQDPTAAILYPIILSDRIEVVVKFPGQSTLEHVSATVPNTEVLQTLNTLYRQLQEPLPRAAERSSQQVYQWLIQPLYDTLVDREIQTLVFVLDTPFQRIPMGALFNGNRYLIEDFAIAFTPGLQLLSPRPLEPTQVTALTGGLTEARQNFTPLPAVADELDRVEAIIPTEIRLLNEDFVESAIETALTNTPPTVIHLATHGQFSSKAEETFILAYDDKINVNELQELLRSSSVQTDDVIELLVLSACQTATGDERAALGLAGVAIRAGARSTLATLWKADDAAAAALVSEFYHQFFVEQVGNKAIALQQAQLHLLKNTRFKRSREWAPFVLLGNWL